MLIVFRTDADARTGTGHLMRCLALADALAARGARCVFLCRGAGLGPLASRITAAGHELVALPGTGTATAADATNWQTDARASRDALAAFPKPDWLVVDHYALDARWERELRLVTRRIMVIDDLADRLHDCDLILDQNFYESTEHRYNRLVPGHCRQALGPAYALLRREFYEIRDSVKTRGGALRRILVAFGGSDPTNETAKALLALEGADFASLQIDVLIGAANSRGEEMQRKYRRDQRICFHVNPSSVAALMVKADASIGAGGTMNWERCYLGLPTIVVVVAKNQVETNAALHRAGAIVNLGWHADVTARRISDAVANLSANPAELKRVASCAMAVMAPAGSVSSEIKIVKTLMECRA